MEPHVDGRSFKLGKCVKQFTGRGNVVQKSILHGTQYFDWLKVFITDVSIRNKHWQHMYKWSNVMFQRGAYIYIGKMIFERETEPYNRHMTM